MSHAPFNPDREMAYLHLLRKQRDKAEQALAEALEKFNAQNAALIQELADAKIEVQAAERRIKDAALDRFINDETDKMPFAGVGIRVSSAYGYDHAMALDWAKDHKMALIPESLDERAFKEICKSDSTRPDFVTVKTVASATIATDLSKIVTAEESVTTTEGPF